MGPVVWLCLLIMSTRTPALKSSIPDFGTNKFSHGWDSDFFLLSLLSTLPRKSIRSTSFLKMKPGMKLNSFTSSSISCKLITTVSEVYHLIIVLYDDLQYVFIGFLPRQGCRHCGRRNIWRVRWSRGGLAWSSTKNWFWSDGRVSRRRISSYLEGSCV